MFKAQRSMKAAAGIVLAMALAGCGSNGGTGGAGGTGGGAGGTGGTGGGTAGTGGTGGMGGTGGSTGGMGGTGGGMGGTGGGMGGTGGGTTMMVGSEGTYQADCAPNDGPAVAFLVGVPPGCNNMPADATPQARFMAYPAQAGTLAAGDMWSYAQGSGGNLGIGWYPEGTAGSSVNVKSGTLKVISVAQDGVQVDYSFETEAGAHYAGTAKLTFCMTMALCG
jgi:hypothetical protein